MPDDYLTNFCLKKGKADHARMGVYGVLIALTSDHTIASTELAVLSSGSEVGGLQDGHFGLLAYLFGH